MTHPVANLVAFQMLWIAAVVGAARGHPAIGVVLAATWLAAHLHGCGESRRSEGALIAFAAGFGLCADSALMVAGYVAFPDPARWDPAVAEWLAPAWMAALWAGFAATLRHALGWLRGRLVLGGVLGALAGPLAYRAGEALGAIDVIGVAGSIAVGIEYAIATPLLLALAGGSARVLGTADAAR